MVDAPPQQVVSSAEAAGWGDGPAQATAW